MGFGTKGCMYNCGDECTGECLGNSEKPITQYEHDQAIWDSKRYEIRCKLPRPKEYHQEGGYYPQWGYWKRYRRGMDALNALKVYRRRETKNDEPWLFKIKIR